MFDILGLKQEDAADNGDELIGELMNTILSIRKEAKLKKDWTTADLIRDQLGKLNIRIKDTKDGAEWTRD